LGQHRGRCWSACGHFQRVLLVPLAVAVVGEHWLHAAAAFALCFALPFAVTLARNTTTRVVGAVNQYGRNELQCNKRLYLRPGDDIVCTQLPRGSYVGDLTVLMSSTNVEHSLCWVHLPKCRAHKRC
jgi:hypothetical protein